MKFLLGTFFILSVLSNSLHAQGAYQKNMEILNAGLGTGLYGIYGSSDFPPISVGLQYGVHEKISVGGLLGYSSSSYGYLGLNWSYSYFFIGARGEYHLVYPQVDIPKNLDLYGGLTLGFNIVTVSEPSQRVQGYSAQGSYALFGAHIGGRYYFSETIGAFMELGFGVGVFTIGASFKL
ncbi:MAG TPA: hypothetical protein VMT35_13935 [Ignavibacteriaceae bacterium]|jgi:hypothetical protein|nr:hypothetical protein [Ignavibacteriaceae bacterium]